MNEIKKLNDSRVIYLLFKLTKLDILAETDR
jgi:hypothetical protein